MDVERGAAWRRRQRRLRSWWRHEQQTVAAVLATVTHHSHSKVGTAYDAPRARRKSPAPGWDLPSTLNSPRTMAGPPGGSGQRHCWSPGRRGSCSGTQASGYELVHRLDVPVPQMAEQLPNIVQFFAAQLPVVAEPVIEVPKIFLDQTPQRLGDVLRQPQMVEQLVDVPTVVSYSSLQQLTAEQIVDIPVPGDDGGGERGGLQGSLPRQNSAAVHVEQTVDIPVPGRAGGGGRGLQGFAGQSSTASSSHVGAADGAGEGVFSHFSPVKKSAGQGPHSGSELSADFNPSTLSAHQMPLDEQLVDVPVPQVHEESAYERETRLILGEGGQAFSLWRRSRCLRKRRRKRWRSRGFFLTSVLAGGAGTCMPAASVPRGWDCTFAHHESELHPDSW